MKLSLLRRVAAVLALAGTLAGCATGYLLDNNVQSFSSLAAVPARPSYRFDRLPSQQASPVQTQIETLADPALFKAGLRRDDAAPNYSVQVSARVQPVLSPWADPWNSWGSYGHIRQGGIGFGGPFLRMERPWFLREVGVVIRELPSSRVVYETRAANDGPWSDNASVLPAMFEAALQGFPNAPTGMRRVNIPVGR